MGKVNLRYYSERKKPWRAQWTEKKLGKNRSFTKWFRNERRPPKDEAELLSIAFRLQSVNSAGLLEDTRQAAQKAKQRAQQDNDALPVWMLEASQIPAVKKAWEKDRSAFPERAAIEFKKAHEQEGEKFGALAMDESARSLWFQFCADCAELKMEARAVLEMGLKAARNAVPKTETLQTALDLWLLDAAERKLRADTVRNIRHAVRSYSKGREESLVSDHTGQIVMAWVKDRYQDQGSRDSMLARLLGFFRWCCAGERGWAKIAVFEDVKWEHKVKGDKKRVTFYTAHEAAALLDAVADNLKCALALGFFTGLRPFEMNRVLIAETDENGQFHGFDSKKGEWHIASKWAKTRAYRRLYDLPDCWWYWWMKYKSAIRVSSPNNRAKAAKHAGKLVPMNYRSFRVAMQGAHKVAGITRSLTDGIRHSFGTHGFHRATVVDRNGAVKVIRGVEWTIALMGHTGGYKVFDQRYNGRCSAEESEAYFANYPAGAACDVATGARIIVPQSRVPSGAIPFPPQLRSPQSATA